MPGSETNILGSRLRPCCSKTRTGFFRDGHCRTGSQDLGRHVVCAVVNNEFLQYSKSLGNDLITPLPAWDFPGLKPGDRWCLCASRWREAAEAGCAPPVDLSATHEDALLSIPRELLEAHALQS
ncbi:MAG: DUF2237 domain-containing protein [Pseudomonadota bacterium]